MQKAAKQAVEEDGSSSSDEEIITLQKTVSSSSSASLPADEASATTENGKSDEVQPKKRKVSNARWTGDMVSDCCSTYTLDCHLIALIVLF